jgi:hypothetical protein
VLEKPKWNGHLDDPSIDFRIILKLIFKKTQSDMVWTDMAQDIYVASYCWLDKELSASPGGLYCMELSSQSVGCLSLGI